MVGGGFFFFNDTATTEIYTLSLHDALPICDDPLPESSWNAERTWTQVGTSPPTYSPYNFHGTPSESGEWFRDKRDGKQLYVPKGGVEGIPEGVLRAEAWKATHRSEERRVGKECRSRWSPSH